MALTFILEVVESNIVRMIYKKVKIKKEDKRKVLWG